jgi:hypothetical protein
MPEILTNNKTAGEKSGSTPDKCRSRRSVVSHGFHIYEYGVYQALERRSDVRSNFCNEVKIVSGNQQGKAERFHVGSRLFHEELEFNHNK